MSGKITIARDAERSAQVTWRGKTYYGRTSLEALRNAKYGTQDKDSK